MSLFREDFGDFDVGPVTPTNMQKIGGTAEFTVQVVSLPGAPSGKALLITVSGGVFGVGVLQWTDGPTLVAGDYVTRIRISFDAGAHTREWHAAARIQDEDAAVDAVIGGVEWLGGTPKVGYVADGAFGFHAAGDPIAAPVDVDHHVRLNFDGRVYRTRTWQAADPEPEEWMVDETATTTPEPQTEGLVGLAIGRMDPPGDDDRIWIMGFSVSDDPEVPAPLIEAVADFNTRGRAPEGRRRSLVSA